MTDKELFNELSYKRKNVYENLSEQEYKEMFELCDEYREFLDEGKTERECVEKSIKMAELHGFKNINSVKQLKAGDKVYKINRNKNILLAVIGSEDIKNGVNLVGAHIDSPRLDLKQNPLYESNDMALLKTHYYGGLLKYQWVCLPLSLIGVVYTADGRRVDISIGEDADDPVLFINDLLPHLGRKQAEKKLSEAIEGEMLMPLVGTNSEEEKTKPAILQLLKEKYNIEEEDFASAELEIIPAVKSRDVGLDRSMIMSHGHDDRVCSYGNLAAILTAKPGVKTQMALFADKEEIGSVGNTGVNSSYFLDFTAELLALQGHTEEIWLRRALRHSEVLSADVCAAYDPVFADAYEENNAAKLGYGICLCKYTGARGKSGSNDANAEFLSKVRQIFNTANVPWQTGELGKVDQGGGGTIAYIMADWGCDVVDCGVAMHSMHAPLEIVAKADAYSGYLAYKAFFESV